jgi:hypothetical protein
LLRRGRITRQWSCRALRRDARKDTDISRIGLWT